MLCHVMSCSALLCYVMLCYIVLRYVALRCIVLYFIPCLEKYNQSEARITVAYSAVCNGQYATAGVLTRSVYLY